MEDFKKFFNFMFDALTINDSPEEHQKTIMYEVSKNNVDRVKELLTKNPEVMKGKEVEMLFEAAKYEHKQMVNFLLTDKQFNFGLTGREVVKKHTILSKACINGSVEFVHFLCHVNLGYIGQHITDNQNEAIVSACYGGNLPVVKYLLEECNYRHWIDIYDNNSMAFVGTGDIKTLPVKKYLILDYNIDKTSEIDDFIENGICDRRPEFRSMCYELKECFEARNFKNELEDALPMHQTISRPRMKV